MVTPESVQEAIAIFEQHEGILRTSDALRQGIHPRTLYTMRDTGILERLARGLYRLADMPPLANPDLVTVALKVPEAVVCLISALAFHELTTEVPHAVDIALRQGDRAPRLAHPPLRTFWFSKAAWCEGVETYTLDGAPVRIYNPPKSVADIFKYRHKLGLDVALEALKRYRQHERFEVTMLLHYARICRVKSVLTPYLEALL